MSPDIAPLSNAWVFENNGWQWLFRSRPFRDLHDMVDDGKGRFVTQKRRSESHCQTLRTGM
jgi:hypothetical protein